MAWRILFNISSGVSLLLMNSHIFLFSFLKVLYTGYWTYLNVDPVFSLELFQLEICIILILFLYAICVGIWFFFFFSRILLRFSFYYAFEEYKYDAFWCFFFFCDSLLVVCCWVSWICGLSDLQIWKIVFIHGEHIYTCGRFILIFGKTNTIM